MTTEIRHLSDPMSAHAAFGELWRVYAKPWSAAGRQAYLTWQTSESARREALRGAFHAMIGEMAASIWFTHPETGERYRHTAKAWKTWAKEEYLGDANISSEEISDDNYADMLTWLSAMACTEFGMEFE